MTFAQLIAEDVMPGPLTVGGAAILLLSAIGILWRQGNKRAEEQLERLQKQADEREITRQRKADEREKELIGQRDDYKKIADGGLKAAEDLAGKMLEILRMPKVEKIAPVIPASSSPPTEEQTETAENATLQARRAAVVKIAHEVLLVKGVKLSTEQPTGHAIPMPSGHLTAEGSIVGDKGDHPVKIEGTIEHNGVGVKPEDKPE